VTEIDLRVLASKRNELLLAEAAAWVAEELRKGGAL